MLVQPFVHYAFKKIFDFLDSTLEVKYLLFLHESLHFWASVGSVKLTFSELFVANLRAASRFFFEPKSSCEAGNAKN